jgi:phosphatidylinositol-3-phosphatase
MLKSFANRMWVIVAAVVVSATLMLPGLQAPSEVNAKRHPTRTPTATPTATPTTTSIPAFDHIFIVLEENHSYSEIIGNAAAPYINGLATQYALATNYYAITHPSLPNYLALTGASTFGITTDCTPSTCPVNARNLVDNIEAAGKTWKGYMESMPAPCTTSDSGQYVVRHDPFVYFDDIRTNATRCSAGVVPYTALANDLTTTATTPSYLWITPNVCDDMHDCSVSTGDTWLQNNLPTLFNSPAWTTQNSVLFITWDEDDSTAGNHVATLVIGPASKAGYQSGASYTHYSLVHTIEAAWGLAGLTSNDANAPLMSDFWR